MPNHVTNFISFKGSAKDIEEIKNSISSVDEDGEIQCLDFEKIIPKPKSLEITHGSSTDLGVAVLLFREKGDSSKLEKVLNYAWAKAENLNTLEKLSKYLVRKNMANLDEARVALDNMEKYGHADWYSWSIENWGTKCNAYNTISKDDGIVFDTAWSTPIPVIKKLSEMFPDVEMTLQYADEDFGYNCGEYVIQNGQILEKRIPKEGSVEALILSTKIQEDSLDILMYYVSSEDEEFIASLISAMIFLFSIEEVVDELEYVEINEVSLVFLKTLKEELINSECYELIGRVDKKINEFVN